MNIVSATNGPDYFLGQAAAWRWVRSRYKRPAPRVAIDNHMLSPELLALDKLPSALS